ncbi:hypothetical protein LQF60_12920 [Tetragenococcus koreensis]|uniref:hypothetical protein n=1 Tax=Tetragenococcus koreensis TaxID=290335 RepID=UPI001F3841BB|nr:hypothetical protein [Tetragenococcus koreensis]MCF1586410.1 hypothetical protein [Tetragenococcus koreensis]MCF1615984.1 hypothetical protein [Tetragenococcus koreensis]MCF1625767.1 hypothetical protein [Tetragenococcus koreensis]MCF1630679.1 hypothetical protein [Tetragenococcus koreensis]MCF1643616.1 hypothetical protein [Tetragenococcus koreensis]
MKWYQRKIVYIPISIIMGILGFGAWFASLLGVSVDDELNKDYFTNKDEPLFKKRKSKFLL